MRRTLLLTLVTACSATPGPAPSTFDPCTPIVLVPADDATAAERASIAAAIALWRERAGVEATLDDVEGAPRVPVMFRPAALAFLGIYERDTVIVNRELTDDAARAVVVAHELGHAFGLVHTSAGGSVMAPGNMTTPPGAVDEEALARLWGACR